MHKKLNGLWVLIFVFGVLGTVGSLSATLAHARFGGGRSFGSRGSRTVTPRSYPSSPSYSTNPNTFGRSSGGTPYSQPAPQRPITPPPVNPYSYSQPGFGGGSFMRGFLGGVTGSFIGSMLFGHRGYGGYGYGYGGPMGGGAASGMGGGVGLLDIVLIGAILFFLFRMFVSRTATAGPGPAYRGYQETTMQEPTPLFEQPQQNFRDQPQDERSVAEIIQRYDSRFDPARFKDSKVDEFFRIQAAWTARDIAPIRPLLSDEIWPQLETQLREIRDAGRINHIENVAVRETELMEAWQEFGKEFLTMRFYANLLDYTTDERTSEVVEGSKTQPVKFEEYWTYSREVGRPDSPWRLTAIEQKQ